MENLLHAHLVNQRHGAIITLLWDQEWEVLGTDPLAETLGAVAEVN